MQVQEFETPQRVQDIYGGEQKCENDANQFSKGRDPLKKNVFFRALPELPKPEDDHYFCS